MILFILIFDFDYDFSILKFGLYEKHTKCEKKISWFGRLLRDCTKHEEDCAKFCVLLRKSELYDHFKTGSKF